MKTFTNVFLTALLALAGTASFAQQKHIERTFGYERDLFMSNSYSVVSLNDSTWITAGKTGPCTQANISAYNEKNQVQWQSRLIGFRNGAAEVFDLHTIISTMEIIAVGGYGYGGDVIGDVGSFITKLDASGNELWKTFYNSDTFIVLGNSIFQGIRTAPDGSIYAFNKTSGLVKLDANGKKLWEKNINTEPFYDVAPTLDNGLMLATKSGLAKLDNDGKVLWEKSLLKTLTGITRLSNGNFAALSSRSIVIVDSAGTVLQDAGFGTAYNIIYSFITDGNDNFYVAASKSSTNKDVIFGYNTITENISWERDFQADIKINKIAINDTILAITGMERSARYAGNNAYRSFIKTLSINGNTWEPGTDAGITRVIPGTITINTNGVRPDSTVQLYNVAMEVDVMIKNYGTSVLDSVSVVSLSSWGFNCMSASVYNNFKNLALQPGDSARVTLGNIFVPNQDLRKPVDFKFAVNTVSPNGMLDHDPTNDMLTVSFSRTITNINELPFANTEIKVFPNPATDVVTITSASLLTVDLMLVNTLGQVVHRARLQNEVQSQLDIASLPAGIYMLRISNGDNNISKTIIKGN